MTGNGSEPIYLIAAIVLIVAGVVHLWRADRTRKAEVEHHQARLADRKARGSDAYFEELRSLEAYPPKQPPRWVTQLLGVLLLIVGALQLYVYLTVQN